MAEKRQRNSSGKINRNKLSYVKQIPDFLKGMMEREDSSKLMDKVKVDRDSESEEENELLSKNEERPQIVVLNTKKHLSEAEVLKHLENSGTDPATLEDENVEGGRILYKKPKKNFTSESTKSEIIKNNKNASSEENKDKTAINLNNNATNSEKKKKRKSASKLSFDIE